MLLEDRLFNSPRGMCVTHLYGGENKATEAYRVAVVRDLLRRAPVAERLRVGRAEAVEWEDCRMLRYRVGLDAGAAAAKPPLAAHTGRHV